MGMDEVDRALFGGELTELESEILVKQEIMKIRGKVCEVVRIIK